VPRLVRADLFASERVPGVRLRHGILVGVLIAGLILALATLPLAHPWMQQTNPFSGFHG